MLEDAALGPGALVRAELAAEQEQMKQCGRQKGSASSPRRFLGKQRGSVLSPVNPVRQEDVSDHKPSTHALTYLGGHRHASTMNTVNTRCLGAWGLVEAKPTPGPLPAASFPIPRRPRSTTRNGPCHPPWSVLSADSRHVGCSWMPRATAGPQRVQLLTSLTAQPRYQPILQSEWTKTSTQRGLRRTWNRTKTHGSWQLDFFFFLVLKATVMFANGWLKLFLSTEVQLARNTS